MAIRGAVRVSELIAADLPAVRTHLQSLPASITAALAEVNAGVLVTLEHHRPWWDVRPRAWLLASLTRRMAALESATAVVLIVAAALIRGRQVLVGQRDHPDDVDGLWEFPGGKVERGESPQLALARECIEELDCEIVVGRELGRTELPSGAVLILFQVGLIDPTAEPKVIDHRELAWLGGAELASLDWVPANRVFLEAVQVLL